MKVQCPNCGAIGRVPDNRIPSEGSNIRCPTCAFVFFVGGPKHANLVVDSGDSASTGSLPSMGQTQSLPAVNPPVLRAPRAVSDAAEASTHVSNPPAAPVQSSPVRVGSGSHSAVSSTALPMPVSPASDEPFPGAGGEQRKLRKLVVSGSQLVADSAVADTRPATPFGASWSERGEAVDSGSYEASVQAILAASDKSDGTKADGDESPAVSSNTRSTGSPHTESARTSAAPGDPVTAGPASVSFRPQSPTGAHSDAGSPRVTATPPDVRSYGSGAAPSGQGSRAKAVHLLKIRAKSGIIYDFHDEEAVRKWLVTRGTFDDLAFSDDGGFEFRSVLEVDHLSDLTPGGLKTRIGPLPAITADAVAARKLTESAETRPVRGPASPGVPATSGQTTTPHSRAVSAGSDRVKQPRRRIPAWRAGVYVGLVAIAALVAVITFAPRSTGPRIPNTPAGQQLRWMLDTIRGNSSALNASNVTVKLIPALHPQAAEFVQRLQWLDHWRESFELTAIPVSDDHRIVAQMLTEGQDTGWVLILTEEAPPHRIVDLQFGRGNPSPQILQR